LIGFDWIWNSVAAESNLSNINFGYLDFFNSSTFPNFEVNSGVLTVASFEQIGDSFQPIVEHLISSRVRRVVQIEPIHELLDLDQVPDVLSVIYMKKRNYLNNYLTYLKSLEEDGKISIVYVAKSKIGSEFINGYSIIVWEPRF
jgi:hypothetical protein